MTYENPRPNPPTARPNRLGLPVLALIGLAAVGLIRVILHDLHVIQEGSPITWVLAIGPVVLWIAVAVVKGVPNPFLTVLTIGTIFGVMLVITHQLLWDFAFQGDLPSVGNDPGATVIPRLVAIPSGLFVGALIGAVGGLVAWGIQAMSDRDKGSETALPGRVQPPAGNPSSAGRSFGIGALGLIAGLFAAFVLQEILGMVFVLNGGSVPLGIAAVIGSFMPILAVTGVVVALHIDRKSRARRLGARDPDRP